MKYKTLNPVCIHYLLVYLASTQFVKNNLCLKVYIIFEHASNNILSLSSKSRRCIFERANLAGCKHELKRSTMNDVKKLTAFFFSIWEVNFDLLFMKTERKISLICDYSYSIYLFSFSSM